MRILTNARKRRGCTTIAHISDLHISASTALTDRYWTALKTEFARLAGQIDVVVVAGDLADNPLRDKLWFRSLESTLQRARHYLVNELCHAARIDPAAAMLVVPGNHDYRIKGVVRSTRSADAFQAVFGEYGQDALYSELRLACFLFDSNAGDSNLTFAAGQVAHRALTGFATRAHSLAETRSDWARLTKLAVLHHHAMPIASTEHREQRAGRPEHMLLTNAGMFVEEMVKAGIEFILHGHQHTAATSKARYPIGTGDAFHEVCVIGAGSVHQAQTPSFYLLTFFDSGDVMLDHRGLKAATYEDLPGRPLVDYAAARARRVPSLAREAGTRLHLAHYGRVDHIAPRSGDDCIEEYFTGVSALGSEPVATIEHTLTAASGIWGPRQYFGTPAAQNIDWKWGGADPEKSTHTGATTTFTPPLSSDRTISFGRRGTLYNAIHFNSRDRLDVTDNSDAEENVATYVREQYDSLSLSVVFPEDHWPTHLRVEAVSGSKIDDRETRHVASNLATFPEQRTATLSVHRPLPSYVYRIVWSLPKDERTELGVPAGDTGIAAEIRTRLLRCRIDAAAAARAEQSLTMLRDEVNDLLPSKVTPGATNVDLEVDLLCYDEQAKGLVVAAGIGHDTAALGSWVLKPGRGIEGQAYRRRDIVMYVARAGDEPGIYEDIPNSGKAPHRFVMAIPIRYPFASERSLRVAILRLASRSNLSPLLALDSDEAAARALRDRVPAWFAGSVGPALELGSLSVLVRQA